MFCYFQFSYIVSDEWIFLKYLIKPLFFLKKSYHTLTMHYQKSEFLFFIKIIKLLSSFVVSYNSNICVIFYLSNFFSLSDMWSLKLELQRNSHNKCAALIFILKSVPDYPHFSVHPSQLVLCSASTATYSQLVLFYGSSFSSHLYSCNQFLRISALCSHWGDSHFISTQSRPTNSHQVKAHAAHLFLSLSHCLFITLSSSSFFFLTSPCLHFGSAARKSN